MKKHCLLASVVCIILSCSSKKQIFYVQDIDQIETHTFEANDYQLKIDDILKIDIKTTIPEFSMESTPNSLNRSYGRETYLYEGYKIDS